MDECRVKFSRRTIASSLCGTQVWTYSNELRPKTRSFRRGWLPYTTCESVEAEKRGNGVVSTAGCSVWMRTKRSDDPCCFAPGFTGARAMQGAGRATPDCLRSGCDGLHPRGMLMLTRVSISIGDGNVCEQGRAASGSGDSRLRGSLHGA